MRGCTILTIVLLYCSFQSEYQEKPDFLKLLAEHTYYLLPLVFDAALPAKVGAPLLVELADKAYFLAPMVAAFVMQFICSTGALTLPFMFHHSRVRLPLHSPSTRSAMHLTPRNTRGGPELTCGHLSEHWNRL